MKRKWTDRDLVLAVKNNITMAGVFRDLGIKTSGTSYRHLGADVKRLLLDTSHWLGQGHNKGKPSTGKSFNLRSFEEILVENSTYLNTSHLKHRLLKAGIIKNICEKCGQKPEWKKNPLVMVLDHINGETTDNRRENLRLLCPNCNSQEPTFAGRNAKKK